MDLGEIAFILAFGTPFLVLLTDIIAHVLRFFIGPKEKECEILVNALSLVIAAFIVFVGGLGFMLHLLILGLVGSIITRLLFGEKWRPPWVDEGKESEGEKRLTVEKLVRSEG